MENSIKHTQKSKLPIILILVTIFGLCILTICCILFFVLINNGSSKSAGFYEFPDQSSVVETATWGEVPVNEVLIMFKEDESKSVIKNLIQKYNGEIVGEFDYINLYQVRLPITDKFKLKETIEEISKNNIVEAVTPNIIVTNESITGKDCTLLDDIYTSGKNANAYKLIGMEQAWQYINASGVKLNDVHVAVIDDGLNKSTIDSNNKIKLEASEPKDENTDDESHGTAVANVLAGSWDNGGTRGVAGGLEDKLKLSFSNVFNPAIPFRSTVASPDPNDITQGTEFGKTYSFNTLVEMKKQIDNGATIINYSMGVTPRSGNTDLNKIYRKFLEKIIKDNPKVLFVAAAGNQANIPNTPALDGSNRDLGGTNLPNVITVGAVDNFGDKASFSNPSTGSGEITLSASGVEIPLGEEADGTVRKWNGTSFATPQVSAAAAIIRSINPDLNASEIKALLVKTADTEISNSAFSERIKEVDPNKNGKIMRLDRAVLEALQTLPPNRKPSIELTEEFLKKVGKVDSLATQKKDDLLSFDIDATIPAVGNNGTDVTITFTGAGVLGGLSTKRINTAGTLDWGFSLLNEKDQATIKITRTDSKACSILNIKAAPEYVGKYKGTVMIPIPSSGYLNEKGATIDITATIDLENRVLFTSTARGSLSASSGGYTISSNYDLEGTSSGNINPETLEFNTVGEYTSNYSLSAPPEMLANVPSNYLSGVISGSDNVNGRYEDNKLTGTLVFSDGNSSGSGEFTISKIE